MVIHENYRIIGLICLNTRVMRETHADQPSFSILDPMIRSECSASGRAEKFLETLINILAREEQNDVDGRSNRWLAEKQ